MEELTETPPIVVTSVEHRETSDIGKLAAALVKAKALIKHPVKNCKAGSGNFSYQYADLKSVIDSVNEAFTPNGLTVLQLPSADLASRTVTITTRLLHESGQYIESDLSMAITDIKAQTMGSVVTYARRYALSAIAGISADDDDDANIADKKPNTFRRTK